MVITPEHVQESANRCGVPKWRTEAPMVLAEHRGVWLSHIRAGTPIPPSEFQRVKWAALVLGKNIDPYRWHVRRYLIDTCNILAGMDEYISWGGTSDAALAWLAVLSPYAKHNQTADIAKAASLVKLGGLLDAALEGWTEDTEDDDLHRLSWWAGWHLWAGSTARQFSEPDCHERRHGYPCWECYDCCLSMDGGNEGGPRLSGAMSPTGPLIGPSPRNDVDLLTIRRLGNEWMFRRLHHSVET